MRFTIDWASLIVGSKFTVFSLIYFVFESNFPSTSPQRGYIWRGDLTGGFFALPVWGACIWRSLYMEGLIFGILRYHIQEDSPLNLIQVQVQSDWIILITSPCMDARMVGGPVDTRRDTR